MPAPKPQVPYVKGHRNIVRRNKNINGQPVVEGNDNKVEGNDFGNESRTFFPFGGDVRGHTAVDCWRHF